ncbi:Procollagen-lysine:2-oxoglutarate 5-dioxygenase 3-like protein, partial [Dinothrombium tinctorium]
QKLIVVTVATDASNDGFQRFNRSAHVYNLNLEVIGLNEVWKGGNVDTEPGGGFKVNLFRNTLKKYKDNDNIIVLFVDSYDVVITAGEKEILRRFRESGAEVLFSAEVFCWPDKSLAPSYPKVEKGGKRYLNSGGFIGFAPLLYEVVSYEEIKDLDDDQLYYTKIYLNDTLRQKWSIKLDHKSNIFQNLNGAMGDVEIRFDENGDASVYNTAYHTNPIILHGNGMSKLVINALGNYVAKSWSSKEGCLSCKEGVISLKNVNPENAPLVLLGIFIEHPTPFLPEFFEYLLNLRYPKERVHIILHNAAAYHSQLVEEFVANNKEKYANFKLLPSTTEQWQARNMALEECLKIDCDYYMSVDSNARLTNDKTLIKLIEQNRKVIAPLLTQPNKLWSNFWGALSSDGYYARSHDYIDIVKNNRR